MRMMSGERVHYMVPTRHRAVECWYTVCFSQQSEELWQVEVFVSWVWVWGDGLGAGAEGTFLPKTALVGGNGTIR